VDSQAIATWAEQKAAPADTPAYRRMTDTERRLILELTDQGLTQAQIAQQLGRAQSSISDVLSAFTDTTEIATRFLRAKALHMAENVVVKGQARDHIQALKGIGVLEQDKSELNIGIQVSLPGMPIESGPVVSAVSVSPVPDQS
jgi:transcriptional regulator with XRE-family HTH domain